MLELAWEDDKYLTCLGSDNKVETWKVHAKSGDWQDAIVKKIARTEKRQGLKRRREEVGDEEEEQPGTKAEKVKVDKDEIRARVEEGKYDMALHFSHKAMLEADPQQRISSLVLRRSSGQKKKGMYELLLAQPTANQILSYDVDLKSDEQFKLKSTIGGSESTHGCHAGPIRGVTLSGNDYLMVTHSFDSINVWSLDFNAS